MVNCNPETVSTDYDTSDRLYFEPLDEEAVLAVLEREQPVGVCIQFGGQTPLKLARAIERAGFRILGTPYDAIDLAEDRARFARLADEVGVRCPEWGIARVRGRGARDRGADRLPGARAAVVRARRALDAGLLRRRATSRPRWPGSTGAVLVDRFLENAIELDVDALCDGTRHLRRGGDGARRGGRDPLGRLVVRAARAVRQTSTCARRCGGSGRRSASSGLLNVQLAIAGGERLRARGEPARVAHGAVRVEGDRREPRRRRVPPRRRRDASPSSACRPSRCPRAITSRRPCCRSRASPAPTRCSGRRCARPAR